MFLRKLFNALFLLCVFVGVNSASFAKSPVVLMTDFGVKDGAVAAMKGVILSIDQEVPILDLTHKIKAFNIQEGAYRLYQTMEYYPKGSVFICIVDPGVGTERKAVVAKLKNGYFFVGPDNGILTYVARFYGVDEIREIDQETNRLQGRNSSYETFHGRDIFAFIGGRLASGKIEFNKIGKALNKFVEFEIAEPEIGSDFIKGSALVLDGDYGNVWTNIDGRITEKLSVKNGEMLNVRIEKNGKILYSGKMKLSDSFGEVQVGDPLIYINSVGSLAIGINQGNFASKFGVGPGSTLTLRRARPAA